MTPSDPERPDKPSDEPSESGSKCPICQSVVGAEAATFPFCSQRCRLVDLGQWFRGSYQITRGIDEADLDES